MYFKLMFTVFLIPCFFIADLVLPAEEEAGEPTEDEILETSFDDCRKWLNKTSEPTITLRDFLLYVDGFSPRIPKPEDPKTPNSNTTRPGPSNELYIGLEMYKDLFKSVCKNNGIPLAFFAKIRKDAADDKLLETSFDDCRKWLQKSSSPVISLPEFLSCIDDGSGCQQIEDFTLLYLNATQIGAETKNEIDFDLYKMLIKEICMFDGKTYAEFLNKRKKTLDL